MDKVLITDVDLTLIAFDNAMPSKEVKEAIKKVQKEKKAKIILATSKPFNKIKKICEFLDLSDFAIASEGAEIIDLQKNKPIQEYCLSNEKIEEVVRLVTTFDSHSDFWIQDKGIDYKYTNFYTPNKPFILVVHHLSEQKADELLLRLAPVSGIFCTKVVPYSEKFVDVHISHQNATKQQALKTLCRLFKIKKEDMIGVGDGYNDVAFISACGVKVAMGNAVNPVKEIADYIAPGVKEDGLATVIEKYLLSPK